MYELVLSGAPMKRELGIRTLDLAKRGLDHGYTTPVRRLDEGGAAKRPVIRQAL